MTPLSAIIITYNEEKNIGRCLESIKDIADEIIVLDSFSTDRTEKICQQYNAKFFQHAFDGHIEQKNRAITKATYPHVLSLDADEALSEELCNSIEQVKENWQADGYYFNRLTNYCGKWIKHCGWYPDRKLRLWDSRKGKWGGTNPHDKYIMNTGTTTRHIKGDLLHYSYYTINQHIDQLKKFAEIKANMLAQKGEKGTKIKTVVKPFYRFIKHYFLKIGFLDGYFGFVVSINAAYYNFITYFMLWKLTKDKNK